MFPVLVPALHLVAPIVLGVFIDRFGKFDTDTEWKQLKADTKRKLKDTLPEGWIDDAAESFADSMIDTIHQNLNPTSADTILESLASGNWSAAAEAALKLAFPGA